MKGWLNSDKGGFYIGIERGTKQFCLEVVPREMWRERKKVISILHGKEQLEGIGVSCVDEIEKVWMNVCER